MTIMPHNHQMWAVIGIYTGREDNIFWRRVPGGHGGKLEAVGARALSAKDADPLGDNIIHSVTNPIARLTGAIHVYGGGTYVVEFRTAEGAVLAISIPRTEAAVVRHFQEQMPYGLFVPDVNAI